jgi:hypothetical protein
MKLQCKDCTDYGKDILIMDKNSPILCKITGYAYSREHYCHLEEEDKEGQDEQ